jgi:hypothetical protein
VAEACFVLGCDVLFTFADYVLDFDLCMQTVPPTQLHNGDFWYSHGMRRVDDFRTAHPPTSV